VNESFTENGYSESAVAPSPLTDLRRQLLGLPVSTFRPVGAHRGVGRHRLRDARLGLDDRHPHGVVHVDDGGHRLVRLDHDGDRENRVGRAGREPPVDGGRGVPHHRGGRVVERRADGDRQPDDGDGAAGLHDADAHPQPVGDGVVPQPGGAVPGRRLEHAHGRPAGGDGVVGRRRRHDGDERRAHGGDRGLRLALADAAQRSLHLQQLQPEPEPEQHVDLVLAERAGRQRPFVVAARRVGGHPVGLGEFVLDRAGRVRGPADSVRPVRGHCDRDEHDRPGVGAYLCGERGARDRGDLLRVRTGIPDGQAVLRNRHRPGFRHRGKFDRQADGGAGSADSWGTS